MIYLLSLVAKQLEILSYSQRSFTKQLFVSKEFSLSDCCQGYIIIRKIYFIRRCKRLVAMVTHQLGNCCQGRLVSSHSKRHGGVKCLKDQSRPFL